CGWTSPAASWAARRWRPSRRAASAAGCCSSRSTTPARSPGATRRSGAMAPWWARSPRRPTATRLDARWRWGTSVARPAPPSPRFWTRASRWTSPASACRRPPRFVHGLARGDHVVAPLDEYSGTGKLLRDVFARWGLAVEFVDITDLAAVKGALRPTTKLVWIETPSNPLWRVTDIAAVAALAHGAGAQCVCDNTATTSALQRPLALGADLVVYATTKYLGGHGDVMGGAVVAARRDAFFERVRTIQTAGGAIPSPFDCWLVRRGIRTLPWRMRAHSDNALRVATFLAAHPRVAAVHYPGLASHPQHAIARRQMTAVGGMLSVQVRGG